MNINKWKWPDTYGTTYDSFHTLVSGNNVFTLPTNMTSIYRNFSLDFEFIDITSADENLRVDFYNANTEEAFTSPNIKPLQNNIVLDSAVVANNKASFVRDLKNFDNSYIRVVINAPSGVTCKLKVIVKAGGAAG